LIASSTDIDPAGLFKSGSNANFDLAKSAASLEVLSFEKSGDKLSNTSNASSP
jgi:hypothetical protein